ncbi:response regulator transcription factor [Rhizobium rhizophilum]|uniref:Response regulator transcription factor n=1 Tax=Rhizobium rhizophilum TaxID=1850373 RepID=A0ABY2QSB0_9HYPH|nr:response regulator transcription factor [Rhizobium rhizophilum]THV12745.1 response regulator transcription factor [Rhizobium rhizophilum]
MGKSKSSRISRGVDDRRRAEILVLAPNDAVISEIIDALNVEHATRTVIDITALRSALAVRGADLLILDHTALIEEDMAHVCRSIRLTSSVAIIILVAADDSDYRIQMLEAGADECFVRSLGTREIKARVTGLLRRAAFGAGVLSMGRVLRFAGWSIDPHLRLLMDPDGRNIDLTAAEFDLLWAFCRNSGKTLSRQTLLTFTRVGAARPVDRSIDVHINRLRRKIEHDPHRPIFLRTVRLGGYVFTPRVEADLLPDRQSGRSP